MGDLRQFEHQHLPHRPKELQFEKVIYGFAYKSKEVINEILNNEAKALARKNPDYSFMITIAGQVGKYGEKTWYLKFKLKTAI
jgi:hypothetical protein